MSIRIGRHHSIAAAGIIEYLFTVGLTVFLIAVICAFTLQNGRSFAAFFSYVDLDQSNAKALNQMTKDFRMCRGLTNYNAKSLVFLDYDNTALRYIYTNQMLLRVKGTTTNTLLKSCTRLAFSMFQRNLTNDTYDFYPTTNTVECKAVGIDWACSRSILGVVTEDMPQAATIVIRN